VSRPPRAYDDIDAVYRPLIPAASDVRILDVGCGSGRMLSYLRSRGYAKVAGVDNDPAAVEAAREVDGCDVMLVDDLQAWLADNTDTYDIIVVRQMIYYLTVGEAVAVLRAARSALRRNGRVIVEVFNAATLTGPVVMYKDPDIVRCYTDSSLRALLERAGFEAVSVAGTAQAHRGMRRAGFIVLNRAWQQILKGIYLAERGADPANPRLLSRNIVAVGEVGSGR
jgi:SAM-dependent methyltransferase